MYHVSSYRKCLLHMLCTCSLHLNVKVKNGCRGTCVTFEKNTSIDYILGLSSL